MAGKDRKPATETSRLIFSSMTRDLPLERNNYVSAAEGVLSRGKRRDV